MRLCVAKNKNNDWKSGFFTVEANVLFVLNLSELFVHWRLRQDEFRGCVLPEAGRDALSLVLSSRSLAVCCAARCFSMRIRAWMSTRGSRNRGCRSRSCPRSRHFRRCRPWRPQAAVICASSRRQACPDGSGAGVIVKLSGNTFPLQSLFNDWRGEGRVRHMFESRTCTKGSEAQAGAARRGSAATDGSLIGRLLALRGEGGDSKSRRRDEPNRRLHTQCPGRNLLQSLYVLCSHSCQAR